MSKTTYATEQRDPHADEGVSTIEYMELKGQQGCPVCNPERRGKLRLLLIEELENAAGADSWLFPLHR